MQESAKPTSMPSISIALEEGFFCDAVVIAVNGKEVFHKTDVTTRRQIGLADSVEAGVSGELTTVDVSLPARQAFESITLQGSGASHLGVSLTSEGQVLFRTSLEPFGEL